MKYRLLTNYTTNFFQLTMRLAAASIAGTVMLNSQPGQAANQIPASKENPFPLEKTNLLQVLLNDHQKSLPESTSFNQVLMVPSLLPTEVVSVKKIGTTKTPKTISTIANTLPEKNDPRKGSEASSALADDFAQPKILIQSNLDKTQAIPALPALEIAQSLPSKKQPKQIDNLPSLDSDPSFSDRSFNNSVESTIEADRVVAQKSEPVSLPKLATEKDSDPYVNRLRADLVKLREQYPTPQVENKTNPSPVTVTELTYSPESDDLVATSSNAASSSEQELSSEASVSAISNHENYDEIVELSSANLTTPDLPGLSSPEEYLPNSAVKGYIWPAKGTFTSGFGWRWGRMHKGIDIAAPIGTPIVAAASGEVIFAGWNSGGYGNLVKLRHLDGSVTLYAHNNRLYVRRGQRIKQGQQIASMGSTGFSTGPHLHFEIRPNGRVSVNPIAYLSRRRK